MDNRILALDLSLSSSGWAVISVEERRPYLLACGHVPTKPKQTHGQRLTTIRNVLSDTYSEYEPFIGIVSEKGFSRHATTTQALYKVHGVAEQLFASHDYTMIAPTSVKKLVTGDGKASKADVEKAVRVWLGLSDMYTFKTDDESDACALAIAYALSSKLIDEGAR